MVFSGGPVHVVRPRPVIALRPFEKTYNFRETLLGLFTGYEPPNYQSQDPEAARPRRDDPLIPGNILARHA